MHLIIDIGNTRVKSAFFSENELVETAVHDSTESFLESGILDRSNIDHCILASVVDGIDGFRKKLEEKTNVLLFTSALPVPLKNSYRSAATLGSDRLAAAVGGNQLHPGTDLLIVDAGTCIKYNFVNRQDEYLGGGISPGLNMRFRALHTFTSRLPLLAVDDDFNTLLGSDTSGSILSGVQAGAVAEVEGIIAQYRSAYPEIKVILTGGDVNFFAKRLKTTIFADPYLILRGLNSILTFNINLR